MVRIRSNFSFEGALELPRRAPLRAEKMVRIRSNFSFEGALELPRRAPLRAEKMVRIRSKLSFEGAFGWLLSFSQRPLRAEKMSSDPRQIIVLRSLWVGFSAARSVFCERRKWFGSEANYRLEEPWLGFSAPRRAFCERRKWFGSEANYRLKESWLGFSAPRRAPLRAENGSDPNHFPFGEPLPPAAKRAACRLCPEGAVRD